ncbi:3-phosphoshikimate 1-carboxyvinyltransferase [Pacificimonas sp. WHA3]|uniref:3-phosphoshikimate 1-carboxyvinyltransferase n=2 Tax=Pacificimonas pallii TaxID=2827236 RepID=A0ABS6SHQ4_9SPHN|nr:3-phosphoshikimate 1-carboxyvinyltransferase [Pacificimonas pallii]
MTAPPKPLSLSAERALSGTVSVPGDKSISHRSLMLGAVASGRTTITGLLEGEDVLATAAAMTKMGAVIARGDTAWTVDGVGGALLEPESALDLGNSGTSARLLMGLIAAHPITATLIGDDSLQARPMGRVTAPLGDMGATFASRGGRLPLTITGAAQPMPIEYTLPVASAQVKSAVLLAGLNTPGDTIVHEGEVTRDHSERMLRGFGAEVEVTETDRGRTIRLRGQPHLSGQAIRVPGDISSAAFPIVAGLIVAGSRVTVTGVGLNPTRTGILEALGLLGANVGVSKDGAAGAEPVGDITVEAGPLTAADIPARLAPLMIDEYPILMVAAAFADGDTEMRGLAELRVKESDRLAVMAEGLAACGVPLRLLDDGIVITGSGGRAIPGGARIDSHLDHRIAMSFAVLGLNAAAPVLVDDARPIETSFPGFAALMQSLGVSAHVDDQER